MSSKIEITESTVSQNKGRRSSRGNLGLKKKVVFEEVKNTNKDTSYEDDTEEDFECKKVVDAFVKKDEPIKEPILEEEEEDEECQYEGKKDKSQEGHEEEAEKEEAEKEEAEKEEAEKEEDEKEEDEEGEEREKEDEEEGEEGEEQVEKQSEEEEKIVEKSKIKDNGKESALKKKAKKLILGVSEDSEDEIIDEEVKVKKTNKKKENKPKGKYESMTMKELQSLAKERNVERRSLLKKRDDIIEKLEELDRCPRDEEEESKPKNKYQRMTIPEIKKIMAERGISGRSTLKKKEDMIAKLLECESSGELSETNAPEVEKKQKGKQRKIKEDPQDEEINRRVAELVNLVYKMKKHSKKQSDEFKEGFIDYIKDLTNQVEDYQESCNNSG
jgi:hypothetical protein